MVQSFESARAKVGEEVDVQLQGVTIYCIDAVSAAETP